MSKAIGAVLSIVGVVTGQPWLGAVGSVLGLAEKPKQQQQQALSAVPSNPATDPAALAEQASAAEQARRKAVGGAYADINPTGGLGVSQSPSLASKMLLGQ